MRPRLYEGPAIGLEPQGPAIGLEPQGPAIGLEPRRKISPIQL